MHTAQYGKVSRRVAQGAKRGFVAPRPRTHAVFALPLCVSPTLTSPNVAPQEPPAPYRPGSRLSTVEEEVDDAEGDEEVNEGGDEEATPRDREDRTKGGSFTVGSDAARDSA